MRNVGTSDRFMRVLGGGVAFDVPRSIASASASAAMGSMPTMRYKRHSSPRAAPGRCAAWRRALSWLMTSVECCCACCRRFCASV